MRKIVCISIAVLLPLTACTVPQQQANYTHGVYELTFRIEQISGDSINDWDFVYNYQGERIESGHRILLSLQIFGFHSVKVDVIEKANPGNVYSRLFTVAICDGGSGETEITVEGTDGGTASFRIICDVEQVGSQ